jgi:hypothetical protein
MAARRRTARPRAVRRSELALAPPTVFEVFRKGAQALDSIGASYCLVGGLARGFYVEGRTTRDVDFAVATSSEATVDSIVFAMQARGFLARQFFQRKETQELATVRFTLGDEPTKLDLLFSTSGIEALAVSTATRREVEKGFEVPVVALSHYIAMKLIAGRPQDMNDVSLLLPRATAKQRELISRLLTQTQDFRREKAQRMWGIAQELEREYVPDLVEVSSSTKKRR